MSLLKVCGVTDGAFAIEAARLGADYLGFVFADGSVRRIGAEEAGIIVSQTRQSALRAPRFAGVFTCGGAEEIAASAHRASLDIVQLHWNADDGTVHALKKEGFEVWRLFSGDIGSCSAPDAVLVDGRIENESRLADWSLVPRLKAAGARTVLAGAISEKNIALAEATGADIIDVSSSIETSHGIKSVELLERLITARNRQDAKNPQKTLKSVDFLAKI